MLALLAGPAAALDVTGTWRLSTFIGPMATLATFVQTGGVLQVAFVPNGTSGTGTIDPGETCDDGNAAGGDCCSSACQAAVGTACADDANACTDDVCNIPARCACRSPAASRRPSDLRADRAPRRVELPHEPCGPSRPPSATGPASSPASTHTSTASRIRARK